MRWVKGKMSFLISWSEEVGNQLDKDFETKISSWLIIMIFTFTISIILIRNLLWRAYTHKERNSRQLWSIKIVNNLEILSDRCIISTVGQMSFQITEDNGILFVSYSVSSLCVLGYSVHHLSSSIAFLIYNCSYSLLELFFRASH